VIGRVLRLLSCGVHVAGENVNVENGSDESADSEFDVNSSNSVIGELVLVLGIKRSLSSRVISARDWRGASLVQGSPFCS
jgi:hypothetical protein